MNTLVLGLSIALHISVISDMDTWLQEAQHLASQGDYWLAGEIYQVLFQSGFRAAALDYNLGVCALACGELAAAIYHLRRAVHQSPWDSEFRRALAHARSHVPGAPRPSDDHPRLTSALLWLGWLTWATGWCSLMGLHFRAARRWGVAGLVLSTLSLVLISFVALHRAHEKRAPWAVVRERCEVRIGNGASYPVLIQEGQPVILYPGWEIQVLDQRPNAWAYISLGGRAAGWVPLSCLYIAAQPYQGP
ncbi:MAG: hypothetical protein RMJ19_00410 [Gemmatales bacterium]|nr:hypothetical protein [Gemmatales bacterium]MDW8174106.1 hypothetical protein [Gemmatales bacterium]